MTDVADETLSEARPLERFGKLEVDHFCEFCGYNLHGQLVARDARLGIMVCRCPECGRYHAAGHGATAKSIWVARVAAVALLLWVLIEVGVVVLVAFGFGGLQIVPFDVMMYRKMLAPDGREVIYAQSKNGAWGPVYVDTKQPATSGFRMVYSTHRPADASPFARNRRERWTCWDVALILGLSAGLGYVAGLLLVVAVWHWPKRRYAWMLLLPFVSAGFVIGFGVAIDDLFEEIRGWAYGAVLLSAAWQGLFIAVGIVTGRKVARTLVRLFVPPRPRQHLGFLWSIDGKQVPGAARARP
jgi:hypothetical protein